MRINRFLASAGVASRRKAEKYILDGRVAVNGQTVVDLATTVTPSEDRVTLDGKPLQIEKKVHYLLNKPKGYVTTNKDELGRKTVFELVPPAADRLFAAGRLDVDSSGLVLITNDGKLANRLAHPSFELGKTYRVLLRGQLSEKDIAELRSGVWLAEGKTSPAHVKVVSSTKDSTIAHITIHEGINRQVRRMFAKVGSKVIELERISIGPVKIEQMQPGECRPLTEEELSALREATLRKKKRKKPPHSRGRSGGGQRRAGRKDSDRGTRRGKKR